MQGGAGKPVRRATVPHTHALHYQLTPASSFCNYKSDGAQRHPAQSRTKAAVIRLAADQHLSDVQIHVRTHASQPHIHRHKIRSACRTWV